MKSKEELEAEVRRRMAMRCCESRKWLGSRAQRGCRKKSTRSLTFLDKEFTSETIGLPGGM